MVYVKKFLFRAVKLTKDIDPNEHSYFGYGVSFDIRAWNFFVAKWQV